MTGYARLRKESDAEDQHPKEDHQVIHIQDEVKRVKNSRRKHDIEPVPLFKIFRFARTSEKVMTFSSWLMAVVVGVMMLMYLLIIGRLYDHLLKLRIEINTNRCDRYENPKLPPIIFNKFFNKSFPDVGLDISPLLPYVTKFLNHGDAPSDGDDEEHDIDAIFAIVDMMDSIADQGKQSGRNDTFSSSTDEDKESTEVGHETGSDWDQLLAILMEGFYQVNEIMNSPSPSEKTSNVYDTIKTFTMELGKILKKKGVKENYIKNSTFWRTVVEKTHELANDTDLTQAFAELLKDGNIPKNLTLSPQMVKFLDMIGGKIEIMKREMLKSYRLKYLKRFKNDVMADVRTQCLNMLMVTTIILVCSYLAMTFSNLSATRQSLRIRAAFLKAILRQDIAWYDINQDENFASRITSDLDRLEEGFGETLMLTIMHLTSALSGAFAAIAHGWQISIGIIVIMPITFLATNVLEKFQDRFVSLGLAAESKATSTAEEVFGGIRTVKAFGGETKENNRYSNLLKSVKEHNVQYGWASGISNSLFWCGGICSFALTTWFCTCLAIETQCRSEGLHSEELIIALYCIINATFSLNIISGNINTFTAARMAATNLFNIIDRKPTINSCSSGGIHPDQMEGYIEFANVSFSYPTRPDLPVIQNLSFKIEPGETVAIIGDSGVGKTTIMQLILRFYDAGSGEVKIDGHNVCNVNLGWLRQNIGLVGQEPVLFETTVAENIRFGEPQASPVDVIIAAESANAHDFIVNLPKKYETLIGEKGTQLSGGQKQRIAIARALIKNPKILLLDEATSALDSVSEAAVQEALDKARSGRTILVIAHRLSTIRTVDKIILLAKGKVAQVGTYSQLMASEHFKLAVLSQLAASEDIKFLQEMESKNGLEDFNTVIETRKRHRRTSSTLRSVVGTGPPEDVKFDISVTTNLVPVLRLCRPEWFFLLISYILSMGLGLVPWAFTRTFITTFKLFESNLNNAYQLTHQQFGSLVGLAFFAGTCVLFKQVILAKAGERLMMRLRKSLFAAILIQDIQWFDDSRNGVGILCSRLSSDASKVRQIMFENFGNLIQTSTTIISCLHMSLMASIKVGAVGLVFLPVVIISSLVDMQLFSGQHAKERRSEESGSKLATEAISSIRTVASLHLEETIYRKFLSKVTTPLRSAKRSCHFHGIMYALSNTTGYFAALAIIYYGFVLITDGHLRFGPLMKVVQGTIIAAVTLAHAINLSHDYEKGKMAALKIFEMLYHKPNISSISEYNKKPVVSKGEVVFRKVYFSYPTRPDVEVLRGLDLTIKPGQTVAFVGGSGCGKSTSIKLLERFYDLSNGELLLDGYNVKTLDVSWLRSQIGMVSQEPVLLGYSIAENIAYGDLSRTITFSDVIEAAKKANIHHFITTLPLGYSTVLGNKEVCLSGGQKQRIAIARALIRNPKLLLLDEATSSLDSENEKAVQVALDKARQGRTCIVIAHRLSTVQTADKIFVLQDGQIVERGGHFELLSKRGIYYNLYKMQNLG